MTPLLEQINQENDIKKISVEDYDQLADELRRFLLLNISHTGGHLAANLGVVELTMALHLFLDFPKDKLIWDVGHQSYVHKILTGRKDRFDTLRQMGGISGFPKRSESDCDAFDTGHSSTSISCALGMVTAREMDGRDEKIVAVIGDGALTGGMAFEALNNAGRLKSNLIIVLNDNNMSISENVGAMSGYLGKIRNNDAYIKFKYDLETTLMKVPKVGASITHSLKRSKDSLKHLLVHGMLFENLGITYIGPIDGHNIEQMRKAFMLASKRNNCCLVHVVTKKGKGYRAAELNPSKFHGVGPFDRVTGEPINYQKKLSYTDIFGDVMMSLGAEEPKLLAITAAMKTGTGLTAFSQAYPDRFFDVGIAEEHAVTFAAGLAVSGYHPLVAVYSTFLQRAYDQVLHDVCMCRLPVTFAIDRSGIVGNDGETHQGIYGFSYLCHIPGLLVMAPKNDAELEQMLRFAVLYHGPSAICYPRSKAYDGLKEFHEPIVAGKSELIYQGTSEIALLAIGTMVETAVQVREQLLSLDVSVTLINLRFASPLDEEMIDSVCSTHRLVVTMEENVKRGGIGEAVAAWITEHRYRDCRHHCVSVPDTFLTQGACNELRQMYGIDTDSIIQDILEERTSF